MAWPWSKESEKLREKAYAYDNLAKELRAESESLQSEQNECVLCKDTFVSDERIGRDNIEDILGEKYQEVVEKNDADWEELLAHYQNGISIISRSIVDAEKFAAQYHKQADQQERVEKGLKDREAKR